MAGGASAGSQNGNTHNWGTSSGETSSTSKPIISDYWSSQNQNLGNFLGQTGITPGQQANVGALDSLRPGMDAYTKAGYYSLADLSKNFGGEWATPANVTAQPVTAQTGASFMDAYKNPFDKDVIDASVNDYNTNVDRTLSGLRAGRDASGAFGDRAALADASYLGDATRGLGSLVSGLRQAGFNTAAGLGQSDANRFLTADQTNAANKLAADTFNNNLTNNRQQFSVNEALQGDQNRMQALRDLQNNTLAQNSIQQGGIGNLMNLLNLGTSTFGQQNDSTFSGQNENFGTSASKSKGGGISGAIPFPK